MYNLVKNLNAIGILIISAILLAAFGVQFLKSEAPCPLCLLQRLGMIGAATGFLLNLRFGVHVNHYAVSLISAIVEGGVALRQIALHVCPGFPTFGSPVLGLSLYTWSFIISVCIVFAVAILLLIHESMLSKQPEKIEMNLLGKVAAVILFSITLLNVFTTFMQCGWTSC